MLSKKLLRIAIFGARGIGKTHARIFHSLGAQVCGVLGSSSESAHEAAAALRDSFGIKAKSYSQLNALIDEAKPDAVSICTPAHLHFDQIISAFDHNLAVFCEKPFFWYQGITADQLEKGLTVIQMHPNRRFFINTSNAYFLQKVQPEIKSQKDIESFSFRFYTQGVNKGCNIAVDLLPHAFSLLLSFSGLREISGLNQNVGKHSYQCNFTYGKEKVDFDFQELPQGAKAFEFMVNQRKFSRIQTGYGATYRVYLHDSQTNRKIEVEDPFSVYIRRFIDYCHNGALVKKDMFDEAASSLRLMANILLEGYK